MKFRWRSWLSASGLSNKVVRRIAQSRNNDNLHWVVSGYGGTGDKGYTVDLTKKTIELWRE